ncbi:MAG: efflux RND transporter periplasmic adaptor subunit [Gemmataceae bacterium]
MARFFRWTVVLLFLGGVGLAAYLVGRDYLTRFTRPNYQTLAVSRGKIETVVNSTGTIKPVRTVVVGAFVSGPITKIYVDFNDKVTTGMKLAEIDPRLLKAANDRDKAAVNSAKAEANRVKALLTQAIANEKRGLDLLAINREYISQNEIDALVASRESLQAQLALAEKSIEQAIANMENSTVNLGFATIYSPCNGMVIEKKIDEGATVASAFQTPEILVIGEDMDKRMHVYASVDEADVGQITLAMQKQSPVRFTVDAYPQEIFEGKILQIRNNSTTTQNVVTYPVVLEAAYPGTKLRPGMTANLSFSIEVRENALRLPTAALRFVPPLSRVREQDKKFLLHTAPVSLGVKSSAEEKAKTAKNRNRRIVWVAEGDLLRAVPLRLGLVDGRFAEILEGDLKEGDRVVTGIVSSIPGAVETTPYEFEDDQE